MLWNTMPITLVFNLFRIPLNFLFFPFRFMTFWISTLYNTFWFSFVAVNFSLFPYYCVALFFTASIAMD